MKSKNHMRFLIIFDPKITPKSLQNTSKIAQNGPPGPPWSALEAFQNPWSRLEALQEPPKTPRGSILEPSGAILEHLGTILEPPRSDFRAFGDHFRAISEFQRSGIIWNASGTILKLLGTILDSPRIIFDGLKSPNHEATKSPS